MSGKIDNGCGFDESASQGKRDDQVEFSAMMVVGCACVALVLAVVAFVMVLADMAVRS